KAVAGSYRERFLPKPPRFGRVNSKVAIFALWRSVDDRSNRAGIGSNGFRAPMPLTGDEVTMDVAAIRAEIPALDKTIYLNTGGYAPSPRRVTDATFGAYRYLQENGPDVLPVIRRVREQAEETRRSLAAFLGVTAEELAFTRAVSEGINIVGWGLPLQ